MKPSSIISIQSSKLKYSISSPHITSQSPFHPSSQPSGIDSYDVLITTSSNPSNTPFSIIVTYSGIIITLGLKFSKLYSLSDFLSSTLG